MSHPNSLEIFVDCLKKVPDPRSKRGTSYPFPAVLAVIFLWLLANVSTLAEIQRWAEIHFQQLRQLIKKGSCCDSPPVGETLGRRFRS